MRLWVHHFNLASGEQREMDAFYRNIMGLSDMPERPAGRLGENFYPGETTYATDGTFEFHFSQKDHNVGFRIDQKVNPVDRGHLAFRTDDIEAFKKKLDENKIPYSDYGIWGMAGWTQIFFYDPAGNVIEVHQKLGSDDERA